MSRKSEDLIMKSNFNLGEKDPWTLRKTPSSIQECFQEVSLNQIIQNNSKQNKSNLSNTSQNNYLDESKLSFNLLSINNSQIS
jgi:hypothetical protein